eukprot:Hpha_TRINITY_DN11229_c0_g4::TRINITY_DN11229_c0_g4_i1::g.167538::m.167538
MEGADDDSGRDGSEKGSVTAELTQVQRRPEIQPDADTPASVPLPPAKTMPQVPGRLDVEEEEARPGGDSPKTGAASPPVSPETGAVSPPGTPSPQRKRWRNAMQKLGRLSPLGFGKKGKKKDKEKHKEGEPGEAISPPQLTITAPTDGQLTVSVPATVSAPAPAPAPVAAPVSAAAPAAALDSPKRRGRWSPPRFGRRRHPDPETPAAPEPPTNPTLPAPFGEIFALIDTRSSGRVSREAVVRAVRERPEIRNLLTEAKMVRSSELAEAFFGSIFQGLQSDSVEDVTPGDLAAELIRRHRAHTRSGGRSVNADGEVVWKDDKGRVLTRARLLPQQSTAPSLMVEKGTDTDAMIGHGPGSLLLACWYLLQWVSSVLCYVVWLRHQEGTLGRGAVYVYAAFLLLGTIVLFGVAMTLLYMTLSPDVTKDTVRRRRYFVMALLWITQDLALFSVEFNAVLDLGVNEFWQGLSLFFSSVSGIVPAWWVWARTASDWFIDTYS